MFKVAFPVSVEMRFKNIIQAKGNGNRLVYPKWNQPLLSFSYARSKITDTEIEELRETWEELKGREGIFLFTDYTDNRASETELVNSFGTSTQGVALSQDGLEFQLFKRYSLAGVDVYRPITRPEESVLFSIGSSNPYTVDWDKGIVTFDVTQPLSLNWGGTFYVPCRLELNPTETKEDEDKYFSISRLEINEVREKPLFYADYTWAEEIDHEYQLYDLIGSQTIREYQPLISQFDSGWETRREQQENHLLRFVTGKREKNFQRHIDYIIALWRVTRGGAIAFNYQGKLVQGRGSLNLTILSENIFSIAPIEFAQPEVEVEQYYLVPPFTVAFEPIFINPEISNDPIILQSNQQNYKGGANGGINATNETIESLQQSEFAIATFEATVGGLGEGGAILAPGGSKPIAGNYVVNHSFWVAGTLHLLVVHTSFPYVHYLYRLNIQNGGYIFEYVPSQLENYKLFRSTTANKFNRIFPSSDGIYVIAAADDDLTSLTTNPVHKGVMIWHMSEAGVETVTFIPNSVYPSLSNIGYPSFVFGDKLFLNNNTVGGQIRDLGVWGGLQVYIQNLAFLLYDYPIPNNHQLNGETFFLQGRVSGEYSGASPGYDYDRIVENDERELYAFYSSGANATPIVEFGCVGKDGSAMVVFQSRFACIDGEPNCTTAEDADYFQVFHKSNWDDPWQIIDDQNRAASNDATNYFQDFNISDVYQPVADKNGNFVARYFSSIVFYRKGAGNAVYLNQLVPSANVNYYRDACPTSNYGLCVVFHNGDLFSANANPFLIFVQ